MDWRAGVRRAFHGADAGLRYTICYAAAAAVALFAASYLGMRHSFWATLVVLMVMRREGIASVELTIHYAAGTMLGVALGQSVLHFVEGVVPLALLATAVAALARVGFSLSPGLGYLCLHGVSAVPGAAGRGRQRGTVDPQLVEMRLYDVSGRLHHRAGRYAGGDLPALRGAPRGQGSQHPAAPGQAVVTPAPGVRMQRGTLVLSAIWLMGAAQADPSPNQGLTGDWGGARTRWYERGVDLQLSYFAEPAYNAAGGAAQLLRSADQFIAGATLDLDKLWGVPQAKVQITFTDRNGNNLSADAQLGTLLQVQQVYGRGNILRLTELSYDQLFFDGVLDVKLGRVGVGGSFYVWSCQFMNLSFCGELPGNIVSTWYNWPVSQWGARTRLRITQELKFEVGIYEVNPSYLENRNGTALNPSGKIGELVPFELDWTPHWGAARLAGMYRFGAGTTARTCRTCTWRKTTSRWSSIRVCRHWCAATRAAPT